MSNNNEVNFIVDESASISDDGYYLVGCVVTKKLNKIIKNNKILYKKYVGDPSFQLLPTYQEFLKENFHYCNNDDGVRVNYLKLLGSQDLTVYIAFAKKSFFSGKNDDWYSFLFEKIITGRLRKYHSYKIKFYIEQLDPKKTKSEIKKVKNIIEKVQNSCVKLYGLTMTENIEINIVAKESFIPCIADYFLGIYKYKLENNDKREKLLSRSFSYVSSKIRLEHDVGNNVYISRKNRY